MKPIHREPAFGAWMETSGPVLHRYFTRPVPEDDIDDLVQDGFVRIQTAQADEPVENVESYLCTTAHNVLANRYREQATRTALLRGEVPEPDADTLSPERITIAQEEYQRVIAAICNLPPRARQAFELNRFSELTYQAIAEHMGISKNSVKELIHRALVRIVEEMEADQ